MEGIQTQVRRGVGQGSAETIKANWKDEPEGRRDGFSIDTG